jgi:hypothetical protein
MPSKAPSESDRVDAIVRLLAGLADGHDVFEVAVKVAELHPRYNTFPGEVYMRLAADALDLAAVDRSDPIAYERLLEDYLPECDFRGWEKRKIQYAVLSSSGLRGGIEPDLLGQAGWRTDDYWRYALYAAAAIVRACSARVGISVSEFVEKLGRHHSLELP